ncbi:MAG: aroA, partial [Solirubrobacterales bacterium]|nr:aroA [Solirubrobacterales bacterium]
MTFVAPAGRLRGTLTPPPDKSITHRAAILGTIAVEPVRIRNPLDAADIHATLTAMRALGALVQEHPDHLVVRGTGLREAAPLEVPIDVGNAGTLMRLLPGWLAGQEGRVYVLDGAASIRRRPIDRLLEPLAAMGAVVEPTEGRFAPFTVRGRRLRAADHVLPMASAQVKSCLLIAGLVASGTTSVTEPAQTRDHTERLLRAAGVQVEREGARVSVTNQDELVFDPITIPADASSAAFLIAAGLLVPQSRLLLTDVNVNWTRMAFVRIAERMGGIVLGDFEPREDRVHATEPVSDLDVTAGPLRGTRVTAEEVPLAIDELPLVALLGCWAEGTTVVEGAEELRHKQSDRISRVVEGLRGLGGDIEEVDDGFV